MAPGSRLRRTPRRNLLPVNSVEDAFAGAPPGAHTESSGSPFPSLVPSRAPTPGPAPVVTPAPAPTPAPSTSVSRYTDEDLQRATKLALESFFQRQKHAQNQAGVTQDTGPRERPFKARFPEMYSGNSHMDCYKFC